MLKKIGLPPIAWGDGASLPSIDPTGHAVPLVDAPAGFFAVANPDEEGGDVAAGPAMDAHWSALAEKRLFELAGKFDLPGEGIADNLSDGGARLTASDGVQRIEVFRASASWRWTRLSAEAEPPAAAATVPVDAVTKANAFLAARALLDPRAKSVGVSYTEVTLAEPEGGAKSFPIETHVDYRFSWNGLPVFGPGAKMRVTFGHDGEVARIYKFWRDPGGEPAGAGERRPVQGRRHVRKRLRRDAMFARLRRRVRIRIHSAQLGYYAAPPREVLAALLPVVACECTASMRAMPRYDFVRYVSAFRMRAADWESLGPTLHAYVWR